MPLIGLKRRASGDDASSNPLQKKRSRIFRRPSATSLNQPAIARPEPALLSFAGLKRRGSQILERLNLRRYDMAAPNMDGASASVPHHRTATPPPPALVPSNRVGRFRALFSSSSSSHHDGSAHVTTHSIPQRKRSVRFQNVEGQQLDGPYSGSERTSALSPQEASHSSWSQRLSDHLDSIGAMINGNSTATPGTNTIVHRPFSKHRPSTPHIDTVNDPSPQRTAEADALSLSPSTVSSFSPSAKYNTSSPAGTGTTSTTATSWTSPGSNGSRNRHIHDDRHNQSKSISGGAAEETVLPPIQEDSGHYLMIPVQEAPVQANPSVTTVENVAAAKVFFETHFNELLMQPTSPRSLRRRRFEHMMADLGLAHDDRVVARQR